ncbi:hypothetical protein BH09SUM1_BH09SUM1_04010 [soil metagenome]
MRKSKNSPTQAGWLFDLYAMGGEMVVWFIAESGERVRAVSDFRPVIHLEGMDRAVAACVTDLEKQGAAESAGWTQRMDVWSGERVRVFAARLLHCADWKRRLPQFALRHPAVAWHEAGIAPEQAWCYAHDISPLVKCRFAVDEDGRLLSVERTEDFWKIDYEKPPLETVFLAATGTLPSRKGGRLRLASASLTHDGSVLTWDNEEDILTGLQYALNRIDPDVIFSRGGDAFGVPLLLETARMAKIPLRLDREQNPPPRTHRTEGQSYFSYGAVLYSDPDWPLYGRWHLDTTNSFMISHSTMDGFLQAARVCQMAPQRLARRSIGTGLTSMQTSVALKHEALVPWKKSQAENWKSGEDLIRSDRGGLVYAPVVGMHERVVELDFMSMFATIMVHHVSPETISCGCCDNHGVPGLGYSICEKRKPIVSQALKPIVDLRMALKSFQAECKARGDDALAADVKERRDAFKWFLVCSFGYLGYRNATFGRTEAHEAVCAFAREYLIQAREIADARGWRMLHANVDSLWLVKPGFQESEIAELSAEITAVTKLPIALEGIYKWLAFLPSRQVSDRPVPTRFYGAFVDGGLKYRGIECRRRDLPPLLRDAQKKWLEQLSAAEDAAAYCRIAKEEILPQVVELEETLWRHEAPLDQLTFHTVLSQPPDQYKGNGPQALAARQAVQARLNLHAGQAIEYIITAARNADRDARVRLAVLIDHQTSYDAGEYVRCLRRIANSLFFPTDFLLEERKIVRGEMMKKAKRRKAAKRKDEGEQMNLLGSAA